MRTPVTLRIDLRDVVVARALDQPGIAQATSDVRLMISNNQRWAAPLGDMVAEILAQDLEQRLPGGSVRRDMAPIMDAADVVMGVVLDRFEADAAGHAVLSAQLTLRLAGMRILRSCRVEVVIAPDGRSTAALVAALSLALGRVADRAASTLSITPAVDLP
ncbi:PqiC family protein [Nitrospirillum sp. BR 11752]|uniref:PqiC family protein n=1 Tax=Nitrospirillum sp. BR 11752 TaxID=3104293 RepID=UPI002EA75C60|nr:PqiC family protein [Nitrospirillum sp. BR 11752]